MNSDQMRDGGVYTNDYGTRYRLEKIHGPKDLMVTPLDLPCLSPDLRRVRENVPIRLNMELKHFAGCFSRAELPE